MWLLRAEYAFHQTNAKRWCPALGQPIRNLVFTPFLQVIEDLLDHHRVFDAGDDFDGAAAFTTSLDIDIEDTFEPLCPGH